MLNGSLPVDRQMLATITKDPRTLRALEALFQQAYQTTPSVINRLGDVNSFLLDGDTSYDGAFARALAAGNHAYVPAKPALGGSLYRTTATIALATGQSITGDGPGSSIIECANASAPVISLGDGIYDFSVENIQLNHPVLTGVGNSHSTITLDGFPGDLVGSGWLPGMKITGPGIPAGATLATVTTHAVTLSAAATTTAAGATFTVYACLPGGDGIAQGQALTSWVDDGRIFAVRADKNWVGFNVGVAYYADMFFCQARSNRSYGFAFTSQGHATVNGTPQAGPLQWYLVGCGANSNGDTGYLYTTVAATLPATTVSVGALESCTSFANGGYGVGFLGSPNGQLSSLRVEAGFYGNDFGHEIHLDSYGGGHVLRPTMLELAGNPGGPGDPLANGIHLTANNTATLIAVGNINGCNAEGIFTAAPDTNIQGGIITNNGLSLQPTRRSGIYFFGTAGLVSGVTSGDRGALTQQYGISSNTDGMLVSSCNLQGNLISGTGLAAIVNTIVIGCLPNSVNVSNFSDLTTDTLHVKGAAAFLGTGTGSGVTILKGGLTLTAGVVGNGITVDNLSALVSAGVGVGADGVAGNLAVSGAIKIGTPAGGFIANSINLTGGYNVNGVPAASGYTGGDLHVTGNLWVDTAAGIGINPVTAGLTAGQFRATGTGAFNNGIIVTAGNIVINAAGGSVQADDLYARKSVGVGVGPSTTIGRIDFTSLVGSTGNFSSSVVTGNLFPSFLQSSGGIYAGGPVSGVTSLAMAGGLSGVTTLAMSGALSGATTITASVDLISNGQTHLNGAVAMTSGGVTIPAGGLAVTGGINVDNITVSKSIGVGAVGASGIIGDINVSASVRLNGVAYTNP